MVETYFPQPGTIAHSALGVLCIRSGEQLSTAEILDAIDQPGFNGFQGCMSYAVNNDLVDTRKDARVSYWWVTEKGLAAWRMQDEAARIAPAKQDVKPLDPSQIVAPRPATMGAASQKADPQRQAQSAAVISGGTAPVQAIGQPHPEEEFALSSAGRLLIATDGQRLSLSKEATDRLFEYLDQVRNVEWVEA